MLQILEGIWDAISLWFDWLSGMISGLVSAFQILFGAIESMNFFAGLMPGFLAAAFFLFVALGFIRIIMELL